MRCFIETIRTITGSKVLIQMLLIALLRRTLRSRRLSRSELPPFLMPDQQRGACWYMHRIEEPPTPAPLPILLPRLRPRQDGEVLKGVIEWYDRSCLKLGRDGDPNLLLYRATLNTCIRTRRCRARAIADGTGDKATNTTKLQAQCFPGESGGM